MKLLRLLLVCSLALLSLSGRESMAQPAVPEHEIKAVFIYNFLQFTQWPESVMKSGTFYLCAFSPGPLFSALQGIVGKTAHGRVLQLLPLQTAATGDCQVVVATADDRPRLSQIRKLTGAGPVLGITDDVDLMREGLIIGMMMEGNRIVFHIDNTRAGEIGLTVSSRLLRLAKSVR